MCYREPHEGEVENTMKRTVLLLGLIVVMFTLAFTSQAQEFVSQATPANPNVIPAARAILDYLHQLPNQSQGRVISGQFGAYGSGEDYDSAARSLQAVFNQTGQWPGMTGMDCMMEDGMGEVVRYLTDMWNQGYLVNLSCHFRNPWTGGSSSDLGGNGNLRNLITPGAPGNAAWISKLDTLAGHLQTLEDRGVVVIWRPLHENNGPWFWWGDKTPADFIALWQHMFNYFTNVKGLNNLLWAYSPNHEWDEWATEVLVNYPGANYVDIVGMDKYMSCRNGVAENPLDLVRSYNDLVSTGKPVALLELGLIPASGACYDVNPYPYRWDYLIRDIKASYPRIVMFQAWEYVWQLGRSTYRGLPELMNDPWVLARHELPNFRGGVVPTTVPTTTVPPTTVPPTTVPPTTVPPTTVPPTTVPTTTVPPTTVPPTNVPPTNVPPTPTVVQPVNYINNGAFNSGMTSWVAYGQINSRVTSGVLEMMRPPGSPEAVIIQNTGRSIPTNTGLEARFDIGNSSPIRKRVTLLIHDGDFTDLQACTYWIPPHSPLRTYRVLGATTEAWTAAHVSIYASSADNTGWLQVDNVSLAPNASAVTTQTTCIDPLTAAPIGGVDGPNLIRNGQFSANQVSPWFIYGRLRARIISTFAEINRLSGAPAGVFGQQTNTSIGINRPIELRLDLANPGNMRKRVVILLHDADFSDLRMCSFWLRPNMPMGRYVIRTTTTEVWTNASVSIYPSTVDTSTTFMQVDNVVLRDRPNLTVRGTECYAPGSGVSEEAFTEEVFEAEIIPPTLEPTATPMLAEAPPTEGRAGEVIEIPVMPTATMIEPPIEGQLPTEGQFTEGLIEELPPSPDSFQAPVEPPSGG
jgi:mannan endo-1,4-beta-mannosidase